MKTDKKLAKEFFQDEVDDYKKEFYESGHRTFMSIRLERFVDEIDKLNLPTGSKCLDAGCGPGYLSQAMCRKKYIVTALDASPEMLRLTEGLLKTTVDEKDLPEILEGDIENLPFEDNSFSLVASAGVLEYLPSDNKLLSEFYRILAPGGYMILSSTNKLSPAGYLEPVVEAIKRNNTSRNACNWILSKLGGTPVRARTFAVRKHTANELVNNAVQIGFHVIRTGYFYAMPFPHPFDRVFPKISNAIGKYMEKLQNTPFKHLFEGLYIVARKEHAE